MMLYFMETMLQISLSTAAVIGLLLLLVPLWQKRYSARWRKVIWLLLAVRLLVPFSLELPQTAVQLEMDLQAAPAWQGEPVIADSNPVEPAILPAVEVEAIQAVDNRAVEPQAAAFPAAVTPMQRPISHGVLFFAIWLAGAVGFLLWHGVQYGLFRRRALVAAQPLEDGETLLQQAAADLQLKAFPAVAVSPAVQGPMLLGFAKPVVLLPQRFYGQQELTLILRHELVHYKFHDLWYKLLLLIANAIHWFNPLVWLMVRQANRDVEQVCDAFVVRNQDLEYRRAYSMTILQTMANQRGVALSTYLSKQAQSSKQRFAAILYPKRVKKGIAALLAVALLAVTASGCLQVGKIQDGLAAYKQLADFLPDNAIAEPAVYDVQEDDTGDSVTYLRMEEPYTAAEDTANSYAIGWNDDTGKLYWPQRALSVAVSKEDKHLIGYYYQCHGEALAAMAPLEQPWSAEQRKAYVQKAARKLIDGGAALEFTEQYTEQNQQGEPLSSYFTCGTMADDIWYTMKVNNQYGYLEAFRRETAADLLRASAVERKVPVWIEGMEETMMLRMNRQPGYYVLFTDASAFRSQLNGIQQNGAFCDTYMLQVDQAAAVKTYLQIGFVPNCTVGKWLASMEPDSRYRPQAGSSAAPLVWAETGETRYFPAEPSRPWQVLTAYGTDVVNICYVTAYREGCLVAQLSMPSAYEEGWGSRMQAMLDTLVLATETAAPKTPSDANTADGKQLAAYLPAGLNLQEADYVQEPLEMGYSRSLWRQYSAPDANPDYWVSLYYNAEGQIVEMENSISQQQLLHSAEQNLTEQQARRLAAACLTDWGGEAVELLPWGSNGAAFYTTELADQEYGWTAASGETGYYYDMIINGQYGYVKQFKKYYANPQLRQQVINWLATEETRLYGNYYHILYFAVDGGQEYYQDDIYTITLLHTMYHQNDGNPDDAGYIQWAKENKPEEYQWLYEDYNQVKSGSMALKLEAAVRDGILDMEHCTIYQAVDGAEGTMGWQQIPGLYVYVGDGKAETAGWSKNKTQVLWAADCYLQAYGSGDTAMMQQFSTIAPLATPDNYKLQWLDASAPIQELRNQLVRNFKAQYGGQTPIEDSTTVQLWVSIDVVDHAYGGDLLFMTLQKLDGQWKVTAASVEHVR